MTSTQRLTVLRADRLFDGRVAVAPPTVVLDGGHVVAVGVTVPGVEVVELGDVTILPGMIDPHVHLAFDGGPDPLGALAERTDDEVRAAMVNAARAAVRCGVTSVRDLGDRGYLSLGLRGQAGLPTILAAGPPVTTHGGVLQALGGAIRATEAAVRAAVRERVARGCDVIKVMAGGGLATGGVAAVARQFGVAELRAAVDEAHRNGLPLIAHAPSAEAVSAALAAGVDGLEHVSSWTSGRGGDHARLLDDIVSRQVAVGATHAMALDVEAASVAATSPVARATDEASSNGWPMSGTAPSCRGPVSGAARPWGDSRAGASAEGFGASAVPSSGAELSCRGPLPADVPSCDGPWSGAVPSCGGAWPGVVHPFGGAASDHAGAFGSGLGAERVVDGPEAGTGTGCDLVAGSVSRAGAPAGGSWSASGASVGGVAAWSSSVRAVFTRLVGAGALVVAGTDAGVGPCRSHSPLPRAVPHLVEVGMSALDVLRTVTSVAAEVCGLASRKGRLAPGFDADLVVVGGDPFTHLDALRDVRAVYLGGKVVA